MRNGFFLISIHALLAESDTPARILSRLSLISIHALLAESDGVCQGNKFQDSDFYPRSPCGERQLLFSIFPLFRLFLSTLSLRRATSTLIIGFLARVFLSTLSLRRATWADTDYNLSDIISIHALLAESDESQPPCARPTRDFYPRSPCGERPRD